jgi:hypothetical protein
MRQHQRPMPKFRRFRRVSSGVCALVIALTLFSPTAHSGAATPGTSSRTSVGATPRTSIRASVAANGAAEVQRYLNSWANKGAVTASQTYLVRSQWSLKGQRQIKLVHGSVTKFQLYKLVSNRDFTLLVTMRMTFSGWFGSWGQGANDRFVHFTWRSTRARHQMEFLTSP